MDARSEDKKGRLERDREESLRNWVFIYKTFIFSFLCAAFIFLIKV